MSDDLKETVLLQEYQRVCDDIRSIESSGDRVISIALAILATGLTFGIEKHIDYIFAIIPMAILGMLFYSVLMYVWIFSLGGYKQHLEETINEVVGQNLLLWERLVPIRQRLNLASKALISVYILVSGAILAVSVYKIFTVYGQVIGHIFSAILILGFIVLALSWKKRDQMHQYTYSRARELFRADVKQLGNKETDL